MLLYMIDAVNFSLLGMDWASICFRPFHQVKYLTVLGN